jgi:hypothetical protein
MCLHPILSQEPWSPLRPATSINAHFAVLQDPRLDRTKAHSLSNILVLAIGAIIAGADDGNVQ